MSKLRSQDLNPKQRERVAVLKGSRIQFMFERKNSVHVWRAREKRADVNSPGEALCTNTEPRRGSEG